MASCSDDDSISEQSAQTDCNQDASLCSGDKPYCVKVPNGNYVCSAKQNCDQNSSRNNDGNCIGPDLTNEDCANSGLNLIITNEGIHACVVVDPCGAQCNADKPYCVQIPSGSYACSATKTCTGDQERQADGTCIVPPDECNNQCTGDKPYCVEVPGGNHVCSAAETCTGDQERQADGTCIVPPDECNNQCIGDKPYCVEVPGGNHVCSAAETCTGDQERQADGTCIVPPDECNNQCTGETPYCVQIPSGAYLCSAIESCTAPQTRKNDGTCAVPDNCDNQCTDETPYCVVVPNGSYVCSGTQECGSGLIRDNDGMCVSEAYRVSCQSHYDCEPNYLCGIDNTCVPEAEAGNVYRYVRIDDLSTVSEQSQDPGADIDAVALFRPSTGTAFYAENIKAFHPVTENFTERIDNNRNVAGDPYKILGAPDAFLGYTYSGLSSERCAYKNTAGDFTFVSLGGNGGYIEVEMSGAIQNGDRLDIFELGGCKLENAEEATGLSAYREPLKVSVSADGNSWIAGATFDRSGFGGDGDNGFLSWAIAGL